MNEVKRYNCQIPADSLFGANRYQQVVLASDYDALAQRCAELEHSLAVKEEFYQDALHSHMSLVSQRDTLRAKVERLQSEMEDLMFALADAEHRAENAGRNVSAFEDRMGDLQVENGKLRAEVERLRKDKDRLDAIEGNCWDVRYSSCQNGDSGDSSIGLEIVGHFMDAPCERVVGENYNENLRAAIDQAMTADAYPPARPDYGEEDAIGAAMEARQ